VPCYPLTIAAITCQAGVRATLTGEINDQTGAVIHNATVTSVNIVSGTIYTGDDRQRRVLHQLRAAGNLQHHSRSGGLQDGKAG